VIAKRNIDRAAASVMEYWRPLTIAALNGQEVKIVKFKGEFVWHSHTNEDELFLGVRGSFRVELRDHSEVLGPGDLLVVPRGVEHRTVADEEAEALLFEPVGVRNTGNVLHPTLTAPPSNTDEQAL
jgi:mannose-6-phosphate isomerase-like protein (cupin superfamily)